MVLVLPPWLPEFLAGQQFFVLYIFARRFLTIEECSLMATTQKVLVFYLRLTRRVRILRIAYVIVN
eukprot:275954-Pleurochrysis_carterae.AAC.3